MFDVQIRRAIDPALNYVARGVSACGVSANTLTWTGFFAGLAGSACAAFGYFLPAFGLIAVNRLFDGLDGCVARVKGPTDLGGYFDIALDMIFYSSVPFAFAVYSEANQLPAAFLIFSFMGTGSSFLAYAVIVAKRGEASAPSSKQKSFFYSTGLIEGAETVVFLLAICIVPTYFPILAWIFGGLCWVTTCLRIALAAYSFRQQPNH